ncbi:rhotekin [Hyalella azteca]|uniref:Rhotekin n=1 Tax=Hyalella azteca TaxID=294128 RepID=A0A8B7NNH5_HYAAZ|nr:rhotekin [Hyalella azteca]
MNSVLTSLADLSLRESSDGRLEVLQDLDLFYIKQLAHGLKEYDLEQRIGLEIKMREGSSKLLAACGATAGARTTMPHALEAAKSLLTSNHRMAAYMAELQNRRKLSLRSASSPAVQSIPPSVARVCISDLRMPLIWKDSDHFKNRGDFRRFAVFVLLKIGTEIYDTAMINPVDRSMTDICFDDIITFSGIPADFKCELEVYSTVLHNDLTMASTPRKLRKTLHSSISRTVGRKLASSLKDELQQPPQLGPKMELVATATLDVDDVSPDIATYDLTLSNIEPRSHQLPLFGHFCCRLAAAPECHSQERLAASLHVQTGEKHCTVGQCWVRLQGWRLEAWESQEEARTSEHHPQICVSVDRHCKIERESILCVSVNNHEGLERGCFMLTFSDEQAAQAWFDVLTQVASDHKAWGPAAVEEMEILTPQPPRHPFMPLDYNSRKGRFTSLYEETPLTDCSDGSSKSSSDDLYSCSSVLGSYCPSLPPPATPTLRPRALTLSRSSFRRWGSARCNLPFFRSNS